MLNTRSPLTLAAPTLLVSFLLLGLASGAAVYLLSQQSATADALSENVDSRRIAGDIETVLEDLAALLQGQNEQLDVLHERVQALLKEARAFADKEEERRLVTQLELSYREYYARWTDRPKAPEAARKQVAAARAILVNQALPVARQLRIFNATQIDQSEAEHRRTVRWMAWGVVGIGILGSMAGLFLGYGMARRFSHSIYQLRVSVMDAATKLGQELPTVTLSDESDLHGIHAQIKQMVGDVEQVIHRLHQQERELLRAEQMASVGQLAAGVAHELRNPLTSIKMLVQTNREEAQARGLQTEDLGIIEQEIRRMERCLQHFIDFARPPQLVRRAVDLAVPVERTLALIGGRAQKQYVALEFVRPDSPVIVDADGEQLQQLVVNLALNALDAMPRGGTLRVELSAPAGGVVELKVSDTGPGIPPPLMARLFRPFVSTKETGLGLGLLISLRIAESHGGTLRVGNRPEGGACFILSLPAPAAPRPAPEEHAAHVHAASR